MSHPPTDEPAAGLRSENKRDKLARIRRAAIELFREKGFDATTTREVAQRAGVATGTLFLYVKNKEELVFLIFSEEIQQVVNARFEALPKTTVVEQLCHVFRGFLEFYARDTELSRVMLREVLFLRGAMSDSNIGLTMDFITRLGRVLADAQTRGELTADFSPDLVASHCFALYLMSVMHVVHAGPDAVEGALAMLRDALELHLRGITAPVAAKKARAKTKLDPVRTTKGDRKPARPARRRP